MQDAGAARNQRTRNGPSGTPAPTGCVYLGAPENADEVRGEKKRDQPSIERGTR